MQSAKPWEVRLGIEMWKLRQGPLFGLVGSLTCERKVTNLLRRDVVIELKLYDI